jgi:adenylylsulfate kinase
MSTPQKSTNTVWHHAAITRTLRAKLNRHPSMVLWFTGLSGSGKSTLAHAVEEALYERACRTFVLDGDNVRHGLNGDLGFSVNDRTENIRRIGEVAKLFVESGAIVLTAFISPFRADRAKARYVVGSADFVEIYCQCALEICEQRDVKGLYKRARAGEIKDFTGISSPYEVPEDAELIVDTGVLNLQESVQQVLDYLITERGL